MTRANQIAFALGGLLLLASNVYAQDSGAKFTRFSSSLLGTGTLANIQQQFGRAPIVESGDAGEYVASVCYEAKSGYVAFLAGELDGPEHNLGGYSLSVTPARPPCRRWPANVIFPGLSLGPLHSGMTLEEFKREVGAPVKLIGDWFYAHFDSRRNLTKADIDGLPDEVKKAVNDGSVQNYYDVTVSVSARFRSGKLTVLRVWKSETM